MTHGKNVAGNYLPMMVTEGVTVNLMPNEQHEFLMPSKEVAHGYGTSDYVLRKTNLRHSDELIEGKHFVKGGTICPTLPNAQPHQIFWTKRGIVRLGFFIKSERAKLFRDWAEELIINLEQKQRDLFNEPIRAKQLTGRNHNRLSPTRLIDIMADVAMIEEKELRERLVSKLMMKGGRV